MVARLAQGRAVWHSAGGHVGPTLPSQWVRAHQDQRLVTLVDARVSVY